MGTVLITGGAGYIGSHTVRALAARGHDTLCFDNLSTGFRDFAGNLPFLEGDLTNSRDLEKAFSSRPISAVIHFASHALVEESWQNPYKYYHDNIFNCLNLLQAMRAHDVSMIVFSSTCATYGIPSRVPIQESTPLNPVNPYGMTKLVIERILNDYEHAHGLRSVSLRYFNAAGAAADGTIGECHFPETHLIPRLLDVVSTPGSAAEIYGSDYPTPDGTCVRDYIHVTDLAHAHVAALEYLVAGHSSDIFNLGTGAGNSVLQVVEQVGRTTGKNLPITFKPRRPGDPPELVADPSKAGAHLGWKAQHSSLPEIVETAWDWYQAQTNRRAQLSRRL